MAKKSLITLASNLGLSISEQYFDYILESIANGQRLQAQNLFTDMNRPDQKRFVRWLVLKEELKSTILMFLELL